MTELPFDIVTFLILNETLHRDYRQAVIKRALDYQKRASRAARRRLNKAIKAHVELKGFRDPTRAPKSLLLSEVLDRSYHADALLGAVLGVWVESHPELQMAVREFLATKGIEVVEPTEMEDGFPGAWTTTEMLETAAEFREEHPDFDENDVTLMLCCLTGRAPLPDEMAEALIAEIAEELHEQETPEKGAIALRWEQWLQELRALPADAPEWETVADFAEALRQLAEEKRRERETTRERLRQALASLQEQAREELRYFDFTDVMEWTAETCPLAEAASLAEQVEQLQEALLKHRDLRQRPAATLAEDRQRREELEKLEKRIVEAHDRLARVLMPTSPPEKPPPSPPTSEEEPPAPEEKPPEVKPPPEPPPAPPEVEEEAPVPTKPDVEAEPGLPSPSVAGLRPSQEVAILLQTDESPENWHALLWAFIAEDDLPAAYWLTRALQASERTPPLPDWLLEAAQGARWLSPDSEAFASALLEIAKHHQPTSDNEQTLIGLAAALRPALIAPFSGLIDWLRVPTCCPDLHDLVTAVRAFANRGIALRPEDLLGVAGADQREAARIEAARAAQRWLDEAPQRRPKFKRASDVWRHLVSHHGELRALLLPVSEDQRAKVEDVRERLNRWEQLDFISEQIDRIDRELVGRKVRPIVGPSRQHLIRNVKEACSLARRWCELVEREREIATRGNWLFEQVAQLRAGVQQTLPEVEAALSELSSPAQPASLAAAALCLRRALLQLRETLDLAPNSTAVQPLTTHSWEWLTSDVEDLTTALSRRLLWLPELSLDDEGRPTQETLPLIAPALRDACAQSRSLRTAFEGWLQKQDYRFIEIMLTNALRDEPDITELSRRYRETLDGSRAALQGNIAETESAIEQAVVDGIIAEERSEYSAVVVAVNPEEVLNFPPVFEELRKVREKLSIARQNRLTELGAEWKELQRRLNASSIEAAKQEQIRALVTKALNRGDTRVVEEYLARLTEILDRGGDPEERWFPPPRARDELVEFTQSEPLIQEWLHQISLPSVVRDIRNGRMRAGIKFAEVPKMRREEAAKAIQAWRRLKQQGPESRRIVELVPMLLRYLGFSLEPGAPVRVEQRGGDWIHLQVSMSASDLAKPIPQFGSQTRGRYDVVCLWERPGAGTIAARLQELRLNVHSVLVIYLGRLTARQRRDVTRMSHERELALAVLDETLLVFLAQERDVRLPVFLRCALPYAALNPYTPFQAGDVPPEMFFGREAMARELQRPAGSCLVYGGRQLGKSALLRHVQREFHHPEREQYAWVEDIKLVGDLPAGQPTDAIWRKLREGFKALGLISKRVTTEKPEEIVRYIREAMDQVPERRVLVLFDEADKFLEADSEDRFRVVEGLRTLMLDTQYRFKVVFAGLHNVQRFQGIPNQPLAHFGAPLCVGPLEPDAAQRLVREPLEVLGYRFADNDTVLRILSYTNYHPGLIQLFCQELLKRLHTRTGSTMPPYRIEQSDVEAVYRNREVRERIRERFEWTLALDMRYQAIAWALVVDQMELHDSYAQAYPPGDILKLVQEWWPQGFDDVGTDQLRGLLDEMGGLGVLVRDANGHYRLRSPNLVRLMGTEADIENRLLELIDKPPPGIDFDNHHTPLDDAAQRYSPLTYAQERELNPPESGVGLVFASNAMGLAILPEAFKRFIPPDLPDNTGACAEIPWWVTDDKKMRRWLEEYLQTYSRHERLIAYHKPEGRKPEDLQTLVQGALDFCRRHRARRQWIRVLFLFDPQATWTWLSLPQSLWEDLENRANAAVFPRRWDLIGVRQRLAQHDKMHSDEVCHRVLQATGGWPILLDHLFDRCGKRDDPRPFAAEIEQELMEPNSPLRQQFQAALGMEVNGAVKRVFDFLLREGEVPIELVTPEFVGGHPVLTSEECVRAAEYLQRMGCVDRIGDTLQVEPVLKKMLSQP